MGRVWGYITCKEYGYVLYHPYSLSGFCKKFVKQGFIFWQTFLMQGLVWLKPAKKWLKMDSTKTHHRRQCKGKSWVAFRKLGGRPNPSSGCVPPPLGSRSPGFIQQTLACKSSAYSYEFLLFPHHIIYSMCVNMQNCTMDRSWDSSCKAMKDNNLEKKHNT